MAITTMDVIIGIRGGLVHQEGDPKVALECSEAVVLIVNLAKKAC